MSAPWHKSAVPARRQDGRSGLRPPHSGPQGLRPAPRCPMNWRGKTLITGPHVLAVIVRPYPARANAVVPPAAVPEMATVSTGDECAAVKPRRDVSTGL